MTKRTFLVTLIILSISSAVPLSVFGIPQGFAEDAQSDDGVTASSGSNRFVVWVDGTPGNSEILFRRSTDNGQTWKPTVNLSNSPAPTFSDPLITVSGSSVFVVWEDFPTIASSLYLRKSADNGATWGAKVKLGTSGDQTNGGLASASIVALGSKVYVAWEDTAGTGENDIRFRRSIDGGNTWKPALNLGSSDGANRLPHLAASASDVYLLWSDFGTFGGLSFRTSDDSGATWKPIKKLNSNPNSYESRIAISGSNVYAMWIGDVGDTETFFRRSTDKGATWKPIVNLSNNPGNSQNPSILVSGNFVYTTWWQLSAGDEEFADVFVRRSTDNGATWGAKLNLSNTGNAEIGSVAVSGSNAYVFWRDVSSNDIFFKRSTDNGGTWSSAKNLVGGTAFFYASDAAAVGSNVFLVYIRVTAGNEEVLVKHSTDNGATWDSAKNLSNNAGESNSARIGV